MSVRRRKGLKEHNPRVGAILWIIQNMTQWKKNSLGKTKFQEMKKSQNSLDDLHRTQ